jgi:hypothetical protein
MNDSTAHIDVDGVRRPGAFRPPRHQVTEAQLRILAFLAETGEAGSETRQGWVNLLSVHGFRSVLRATARCCHLVGRSGLVTNAQAQGVLDGRIPSGAGVQPERTGKQAG